MADDVAYSFTRVLQAGALDGEISSREDLLGPTTSVEKVGDRVVRFHLSAPWPVLPATLTFQEVVSKASTEKAGTAGMATAENGSGPFRLVQWRRGDGLVVERFSDYFGGAPAIPVAAKACIDRVIIKISPENARLRNAERAFQQSAGRFGRQEQTAA